MFLAWFQYPAEFINWAFVVIRVAYDWWDNFIINIIPSIMPDFMVFDPFFELPWWHTALLVIFYLGLYILASMFLWRIVAIPFTLMREHAAEFNCKLIPWWVIVWTIICYIFETQTDVFAGTTEHGSVSIFTVAGWAIYLLYYLIKVKWRIIYFPLLSVAYYAYFLLCLGFALLPLIIMGMFMLMGGALSAWGSNGGGVETCGACGTRYRNSVSCPRCGGS